MGEAIVVTSGKGGVGKSTVTANIGVMLASRGLNTLVIDTDLGLRNLDILLGVSDKVVFHLVDVLDGSCPFERAAITDSRYENLTILPATQTGNKSLLDPERMREFILPLKEKFDYILTDCPAGLDNGFLTAAAGCDRGIIVITPDLSSLRDADRIAGLLELNQIKSSKIIINKVRPNMVKNGGMLNVEDILDTMGLDLLGIIPDDELAISCANKGTPVSLQSKTLIAKAYANITERILGKAVPLLELDPQDKKRSLWKRIFHSKKIKI